MTNEVLCWNCSEKTDIGFCHNCGVEISTTDKSEEVEKETYDNSLDYLDYDYNKAITFLIGANVLFYILTLVLSRSFFGPSGSIIVLFGSSADAMQNGRYYTLLTSILTHGSWLHLFVNMYALNFLGEKLGKRGYSATGLIISFLVIGLIESFLTTLIPTSTVTVGASGALFGWVGWEIVKLYREGSEKYKQYLGLAIGYLIISFFIPFISFFGHLFGFLVGLALAWASAFEIFRE